MFVFGRGLAQTSSIRYIYIYLLIFSIVMIYKDLNHLNLTISDKLLGVASHFLQLFMPGLALWTYSSHASEFLLLGMKVSDCSAPPVPAGLS